MSLKFSLKINRQPVVLEGEDGTPVNYELREMNAAQRDQYLDSARERMSIGPDGKANGVARVEGMQAELLSQCLYKDGAIVGQQEIQTWPSHVVQELFKAAQVLNHMGGEEPPKNA